MRIANTAVYIVGQRVDNIDVQGVQQADYVRGM